MAAIVVTDAVKAYYPPPESRGGWRTPENTEQTRAMAGIDPERLLPARAWNRQFGIPSVVVIIRHGYLVAEWCEFGTDERTHFNIHSCTKSFTGTAYGILLDDAAQGTNATTGGEPLDLDSPAYPHIPEGHPLTDPRKEQIRLRHLLSMSSGIPGESAGIFGVVTAPDVNQFEGALGYRPLHGRGTTDDLWAAQLAADPGTRWDYSDPAFAHLSLAFRHLAGQELAGFMQDRVLGPIGIENIEWEQLGLDDGHIGAHTNPFSGVHIAARELARFGYLMLRQGVWQGQQIVAPWWLDLCTKTSQAHNPRYGFTWWVNTQGTLWPAAPRDAFSALGYNTNLCAVIPSLDLVVVRVGSGPTEQTETTTPPFFATIVNACLD
jgi:CubicO group peptidase (beta-lactamase class C family)